MPFGVAASAAIRQARGPRPGAGPAGFENFNFGGAERPTSATCSRACSAAPQARGSGGGPFGGFRQRARAAEGRRRRLPAEGRRSTTPSRSKPQRITLADGKTIDLKLPPGRRGRHPDPPRRQGPGRARRRAATRSSPSRSQPHRFFTPRGDNIRARPADHAQGSGARRQGEGADAGRAGDADDPQGLELGQGAAPQGQGLHRQGRRARRPAGHVEIDVPPTTPSSQQFVESWRRRRQPARGARRLARAAMRDHLPAIAGSHGASGSRAARGLRHGGRGEAQAAR